MMYQCALSGFLLGFSVWSAGFAVEIGYSAQYAHWVADDEVLDGGETVQEVAYDIEPFVWHRLDIRGQIGNTDVGVSYFRSVAEEQVGDDASQRLFGYLIYKISDGFSIRGRLDVAQVYGTATYFDDGIQTEQSVIDQTYTSVDLHASFPMRIKPDTATSACVSLKCNYLRFMKCRVAPLMPY